MKSGGSAVARVACRSGGRVPNPPPPPTHTHPLNQAALASAKGYTSRQRVTLLENGNTTHFLPSVCFLWEQDFDVCESGPGWGGWSLCGRLGPNERLHNSGLLCLFTLSPSCQDLRDGTGAAGGGHTTRLKQKQASAVSTFSDFISLKTFEEILKPLTQSVGQTCNFPATNNNRTGSMKDYQK